MIPERFWLIVVAFLKARKDGSVTFIIHDGNVLQLEVKETVR